MGLRHAACLDVTGNDKLRSVDGLRNLERVEVDLFECGCGCADYGVLLGEALATIESGCDDYTPVG